MYAKRYDDELAHRTAAALTEFAKAHGTHAVSLAVAWAAAQPGVTAPIIGARSLEQLSPSLAALDVDMNDELSSALAALSPRPAPATDRLEEHR